MACGSFLFAIRRLLLCAWDALSLLLILLLEVFLSNRLCHTVLTEIRWPSTSTRRPLGGSIVRTASSLHADFVAQLVCGVSASRQVGIVAVGAVRHYRGVLLRLRFACAAGHTVGAWLQEGWGWRSGGALLRRLSLAGRMRLSCDWSTSRLWFATLPHISPHRVRFAAPLPVCSTATSLPVCSTASGLQHRHIASGLQHRQPYRFWFAAPPHRFRFAAPLPVCSTATSLPVCSTASHIASGLQHRHIASGLQHRHIASGLQHRQPYRFWFAAPCGLRHHNVVSGLQYHVTTNCVASSAICTALSSHTVYTAFWSPSTRLPLVFYSPSTRLPFAFHSPSTHLPFAFHSPTICSAYLGSHAIYIVASFAFDTQLHSDANTDAAYAIYLARALVQWDSVRSQSCAMSCSQDERTVCIEPPTEHPMPTPNHPRAWCATVHGGKGHPLGLLARPSV